MKVVKKLFSALMLVVMVVAILPLSNLQAKEIKLAVPKVKISTVKNGTGVQIKISKTKDAEGFEIYASGKSELYGDYKYYIADSGEYGLVESVNEDGTKKRTIVVKTLSAGNYKIKVRSYNTKKFGTKVYSDFGKATTVSIKENSNVSETAYDFDSVKKGDIIKFGSYEQDADFTNGKEAIEWVVLEKNKSLMFVVSKYALDALPYNTIQKEVTWKSCTLREWLNHNFYDTAFTDDEKEMIKTKKVENYDNAEYGTAGGSDTKDKVFLLSQSECNDVDLGFESSNKRICVPTAYARQQRAETRWWGSLALANPEKDGTWWWLRSPGNKGDHAAYVGDFGSISTTGNSDFYNIVSNHAAIRPAICIKVKK